jgi:archaellum component FlaG (FlaF/FlaG flagellin family)
MKKALFSITAIFIATASIIAQEPVKTPAPAVTSLAEITFDKDVHDFGKLDYAGNGTYEFRFKNTGKEPLVISNAQGSCGCTVPTYPKDVLIMPGNFEFIKVTYDTKRPGNFTKTVTVKSNAKTGDKVITIKGVVAAQVVEETFPSNGTKVGAPVETH